MGQEMGPNGRELGLDGDRLVRLVRETPNTRIVDTPCSQRHGILGWSVCPSHQSLFFHFLQGSLDNMTCMVVCFPGAPRPCEEAISKEMALDAVLSHKVAELYASAQEPPCLNTVFRTLASEDIPGLPPGGGLHSKATVIAEAYSKLHQTPGECQEKR